MIAVSGVGCEDLPPNSYLPEPFVEAYLIVDEPIEGLRIHISQSVTDTFRSESGVVDNATVEITSGDRVYPLVYRVVDGRGEYHLPDTTVLVEPTTRYDLKIRLDDGTLITGTTTTPARIQWIRAPDSVLRYPKDTINLPKDSVRISWTPAPGLSEYIIGVTCLDTLDYGRYLEPPVEERNRRIERFFEQGAPRYNDAGRIGFTQGTEVPVTWFAFKWFGRHDIAAYAPDRNMNNWFKLTHFSQNPQYNPLYGSVNGGIGVFGSASVARREIFLYKNQP